MILGVVVPRVSQMFADAGERLPWYTQAVVSNDLKGHSGLIVHGIENVGPEYAPDLPVIGISAFSTIRCH